MRISDWSSDVCSSDLEARAATGATASAVFVPPRNAAAAIIESIDAGIGVMVCVTERVPVLDMVRVKRRLEGSASRLVGPNSQGLLDRKSVVAGQSVSVSGAVCGHGIMQKKKTK